MPIPARQPRFAVPRSTWRQAFSFLVPPRRFATSLACLVGLLSQTHGFAWAEGPPRMFVAGARLAEAVDRIADDVVVVRGMRTRGDDAHSYEWLHWQLCQARTRDVFVFPSDSDLVTEDLWRERLSNQGWRVLTVEMPREGGSVRWQADLLLRAHALLVQSVPAERDRFDRNLEREMQRLRRLWVSPEYVASVD